MSERELDLRVRIPPLPSKGERIEVRGSKSLVLPNEPSP
jgi:hypothetical protein